jgi:hypothetical protein
VKNKLIRGRILTAAAVVLVWIPILAPFLFSAVGSLRRGHFLFDFLAPAELFPVFLLGGLLIVGIAFRGRSPRRVIIAAGVAAAVVFLVLSQVAAVLTGLASGTTEPGGWPWVLVLALLGASFVAMLVIGISGIRLLQDLFRR